jgi:hypothetical protein
MENKLEVSFNSPQCGWMSIGFDDGENEFHTTTAYTPHALALAEILNVLSALLEAENQMDDYVVQWSRNPEEYKLFFRRYENIVHFQVIEYPPPGELKSDGEIVFSTQASPADFCKSFYDTFAQLYEDRETDEFEFNWRQPFPFAEFENFKSKLQEKRI